MDAGTLKELRELISQTGFPIFVASFFLWRLEKRLDRIFRVLYLIYGGKRGAAAELEEEETQA